MERIEKILDFDENNRFYGEKIKKPRQPESDLVLSQLTISRNRYVEILEAGIQRYFEVVTDKKINGQLVKEVREDLVDLVEDLDRARDDIELKNMMLGIVHSYVSGLARMYKLIQNESVTQTQIGSFLNPNEN